MTRFIEIASETDFLHVLKLDKAIIYLLVDWSGPERFSRNTIYKALNEINHLSIPIFQIDGSDQSQKYIEDWLLAQRENSLQFHYGGWGETLLVSKGEIIDFIKNPGQIGVEKTKEKLAVWSNNNHN